MLKNSVMILRCLKISSPSSQIFFFQYKLWSLIKGISLCEKVIEVCVHLHIGNLTFFFMFLNSYSFVFCNTTRLNKHLILNNSSQKLKLNEQSLITQFIDVLCKQYTLYVVQVMADIAIILWAMHKMKT